MRYVSYSERLDSLCESAIEYIESQPHHFTRNDEGLDFLFDLALNPQGNRLIEVMNGELLVEEFERNKDTGNYDEVFVAVDYSSWYLYLTTDALLKLADKIKEIEYDED